MLFYDKTTLSQNGSCAATPMYAIIANSNLSAMKRDSLTDIIGYVLEKQTGNTEIKEALEKAVGNENVLKIY